MKNHPPAWNGTATGGARGGPGAKRIGVRRNGGRRAPCTVRPERRSGMRGFSTEENGRAALPLFPTSGKTLFEGFQGLEIPKIGNVHGAVGDQASNTERVASMSTVICFFSASSESKRHSSRSLQTNWTSMSSS